MEARHRITAERATNGEARQCNTDDSLNLVMPYNLSLQYADFALTGRGRSDQLLCFHGNLSLFRVSHLCDHPLLRLSTSPLKRPWIVQKEIPDKSGISSNLLRECRGPIPLRPWG